MTKKILRITKPKSITISLKEIMSNQEYLDGFHFNLEEEVKKINPRYTVNRILSYEGEEVTVEVLVVGGGIGH